MSRRVELAERSVRDAAAEIVEKVLSSKTSVDPLLARALGERSDRDRSLLRTIVSGTLRWRLRIEDVIERASGRKIRKIQRKLRGPLRVAVYQLLYLDRVPSHAIVHEAVRDARRRTHSGGGSFVNAVLRKVAVRRELSDWPVGGDRVERIAIETSYPPFLVERWLARWGEETTREILDAGNWTKPIHLLSFSDRGGVEGLRDELAAEEVGTRRSTLSEHGLLVVSGDPTETAAFRKGRLYIQDEAAQAAALVPLPMPEERIFDAAAAPGGKSFALTAAEPSVRVVAGEVDLSRLARLAANARRLKRSVPCLAASAVKPALRDGFDRVIVDYPCTGSGTFRKHPELKWRIDPSEIDRLAEGAKRLVAGVADLVGPGGLLIGISCSLEPEENEGWVADFLRTDPRFERARLTPEQLAPAARPYLVSPGLWQLPTGDDHDGMTVNVLRRRTEEGAGAPPSV